MKVSVEDRHGSKDTWERVSEPDTCPICNYAIAPKVLPIATLGNSVLADSHFTIQVVMQCPRQECSALFIAYYRAESIHGVKYAELSYCQPSIIEPPRFEEEVNKLSPGFVECFVQADAAEKRGLDELAGLGYRKALEFLVKDYLVSLAPDRADSIKAAPLQQCIRELHDEKVRSAAERATWLGNDEAHYVRLWEEHDVKDLKALVTLTLYLINAEHVLKGYKTAMPFGRGRRSN